MIRPNEKSGVYKITNLINGKFYIGSSHTLYIRIKTHLRELKHNRHCNKHLQNAWKKYGKDNFKFEIISICPKEYRDKLEQWFIDNLKPEYNIQLITNLHKEWTKTLEQRLKTTKITESQINIVQKLTKQGISARQIYRDTGIANWNVKRIIKCEDRFYKLDKIKSSFSNRKLSTGQLQELKTIFIKTNCTYQELADKYNVSKASICLHIKNIDFSREYANNVQKVNSAIENYRQLKLQSTKRKRQGKGKIYMYNDNNILIATFNSKAEACYVMNLHSSSISDNIKGTIPILSLLGNSIIKERVKFLEYDEHLNKTSFKPYDSIK